MKGSVIFLRWRCVRRLSMGADIRRMRDRIRNRDSGQRRRDAGRHGGLVQPDSGRRGHHDAGLRVARDAAGRGRGTAVFRDHDGLHQLANGSGGWCRVPLDAVNSLTTGSEY